MADTAIENSTPLPPSAPELKLVFTSYLDADLSALRPIKAGAGNRVNVSIKG